MPDLSSALLRSLRLAAASAGVAGLLLGCQAILGFGDAPTALSDGADAASDSGDQGLNCGGFHNVSTPQVCSVCTNGTCCNELTACGADPSCVKSLACVIGCAGDGACSSRCPANNQAGVTELCIYSNCKQYCVPTGNCVLLGSCCQKLSDSNLSGATSVAQTLLDDCRSTAIHNDQVACTNDFSVLASGIQGDGGIDAYCQRPTGDQ